ncbi:hypothetical protein [Streptomyces sp. NPDC058745]|uniref:hypothetical protein n=1 Tax=Streptomyces sp. NPDC058745 TaxID=3346621 RepID=UPI0036BE3406
MPGLLAIGAITSIGLGAILVFAVDWQWEGADRPLVGLIMMAVGMLALIAATHMYGHDSRSGKTS